MTVRLDPLAAAPSLMKEWHRASLAISGSLDPALAELIEIRSSQINGCANCINMHSTYARERGETEQRIYLLSAWREAPCYTDRERAALGWTEALTLVAETHAPDDAYEAVEAQFKPKEIVDLTLLISTINAWNRIAIGFRAAHPEDVKHKAA